ncbi:nudix (nucleoside diphosphate linked moiety X)-type motif 8 [Gryganskiella cystojenkinii]|nr:nudix (nucleoside diphosphate linked moiety X)-type motif 8 [Gryganskiella cystojenkinii]
MSAFLLPATSRCPQRSMLSHFVTPATAATSSTIRSTRATTTATRSRSFIVSQKHQHQQQQQQSQDNSSSSLSSAAASSISFANQAFLLSATNDHADTKIFAPQYQQHVPLPLEYRFQLPYQPPPVPQPSKAYLQQLHEEEQQRLRKQEVFPSHLQRVKRQPHLKHASYASKTIPQMMKTPPRAMPTIEDITIRFDTPFLELAKKRLETEREEASHHFEYCKDRPLREAAVFMPLCIVKGVPSVLFTMRSTKLRNHRGECSFPGGKQDASDTSLLRTALREMQEEIFVSPSEVDILGEYACMPNKDCTMRVQPIVGLIRKPIEDINDIRFNTDEVQKVFTIPIRDLLDERKRSQTLVRFRDSKYMYPVFHAEGGKEMEGCTVWGLTAFILDGVLRKMWGIGPKGALIVPEGANVQRYRPTPALAPPASLSAPVQPSATVAV